MSKPIRLPKRQMDKSESHIMWDFLHEVWYPTYPTKYRNSNPLERWSNGNLAKHYIKAGELVRTNGILSTEHKFILNSLIPKWKADGRDEFLQLYKEYKKNKNE